MAKNELDLQMEDYQYLPLRDVVFRTLRQAILRGELKPGERLMEIRLANQLGVSRTPIREAIRMLELDGLVIMVPRKGAQVAQITEKDLNDVLEVRLGLEELAVKLACHLPAAGEQSDALQSGRNVVHYMGIITIHPKGGRGFGDRGKTPAAGRQRLPGVLFLFHRAVFRFGKMSHKRNCGIYNNQTNSEFNIAVQKRNKRPRPQNKTAAEEWQCVQERNT